MKLKIFIVIFSTTMSSMHSRTEDAAQPNFSEAEIFQMVAPIALYPDSLLSQILMACTYPLEIVSAARFASANPDLTGEALTDALQKQTWDESVKSLVAFPQVLNMLNEKLDMTQKLGDAFLGQQQEVLGAIQSLRKKAQEAGNLVSGAEQVVAQKQDKENFYITIAPTNAQIVYVPTYNPNEIYGTWPFSSYPPYSYYPPDYLPRSGFYFGRGLWAGNALWGYYDWRQSRVHINVNRFNRFHRTKLRDREWRHHSAHRRGVGYRHASMREKFGKVYWQNVRARDGFRGRSFEGFGYRGKDHSVQSIQRRDSRQGFDRFRQTGRRFGTFDGVGRGREMRNFSSRGKFSRSSSRFRGSSGGGRRGGGGRRR